MLRGLIKVILTIALIVIIGYAGLVLYSCTIGNPNNINAPEAENAAYIIKVENTGRIFLTNDYEKTGSVYKLNGYWVFEGKKFEFKNKEYLLDEAIFGEITLRRRSE